MIARRTDSGRPRESSRGQFTLAATAVAVATALRAATITPKPGTPSAGSVRFSEHLIKSGYAYPYGIAAGDLDGDGDLDLTSADALPHNALYWFENDGKGSFVRRLVQKDDPERLERHAIGDINRDGRPDVVIVKNLHGDLLWFENHQSLLDGRLWKRHIITRRGLPGAYDVALADFDRDGDLDVAASSWTGNAFAWFENDGTPEVGEWTKHVSETNVAETRTIRAADFDADGDVDLLGTASAAGQVIWYENCGKTAPSPWKKHLIDTSSRPIHGQPADLDGDGDVDVVMALGMGASRPINWVLWYENDGTPADGPWQKHFVCESSHDWFEAIAADLDGDGDLDIAATGWRRPGRLVWFENQGNPRGAWVVHVLKDNWRSANQVIAADLDGDGDLDLAAVAERGTLESRWWRNEGRRDGR